MRQHGLRMVLCADYCGQYPIVEDIVQLCVEMAPFYSRVCAFRTVWRLVLGVALVCCGWWTGGAVVPGSDGLTWPGKIAWNDSLMIDPDGFVGKAPLLNSGVWTWITTIFGMPIFSVFAYRAAPRNCPPCSE